MDDRNWNNNKVNYGEVIARLMMVLVGFIIVFLGFITFIHSGDHRILGILLCFAGTVTMFGVIPNAE